MLTSRIRLLPSSPEEEETQEDILSSSLAVIFPDDITNQHGDAQNSVIYTSPSFGDITLSLADPEGEGSRSLFSHFVWNAAVELGVLIEGEEAKQGLAGEVDWSVKGEKVLELGAGTGLAGIIASLKSAEEVVISDYPAPEILANIQNNITRNIDSRRKPPPEAEKEEIGPVTVQGHEWGVLSDPFSLEKKHTFTRILVADCLWMPWQHVNLLASISHFITPTPSGKVWVIAGFHTGREKMRGFYEDEKLKAVGLEIERIWERNAEGVERSWVEDKGVEDVTERKRWLVIAVLRRRRVKAGVGS